MFDCETDPLELLNRYDDPACQQAVQIMTGLLNQKMREIGDDPAHPVQAIMAGPV